MSKRNIEAIYSLSPMQQGMLFHSLYAPESGVYVEQTVCTLEGDLDVPSFERAWKYVTERHPILRTAFAWKRLDKTFQVVHREVHLPFEQHDWRGLSAVEQASRLEDFLQVDRRRGFDVSKAPLMRLALIRTTEESWRFVWTNHHALLDGWSLPLLLKQVLVCYDAYRQSQSVSLESVRPYRDYISWLQKQDQSQARLFWRKTLAGFTAPTPLVVDRPAQNTADQEARSAELETRLSAATTATLQSLARQHQLTMNTLVQGAWAILLNRYSSEEDIVFGATVSGRPADLPGSESMLGLFINTLPVRVRVRSDALVVPWLKELQAQQVELRQFEYSPLVQIQSWSDVPRGLPLFDSILVFENYPMDAFLQITKSLRIRDVRSIEQTNYPLTVVSGPGEELVLKISYDERRFDAKTITRMLGHLKTLLEEFAAHPEASIGRLDLLTPAEQQQILIKWNDTAADYPHDRCIHQLVEAQAEQTPDAIAVTFEDKFLTYRELNARANQLARYLQKMGVCPETLVGICVERSLEMIVGILGISKAGGAYVPLDPTYPPERLAFMLTDSQVSVLLTQAHLVSHLTHHALRSVVCLDSDWETLVQEDTVNLTSAVTPENLAYVIYTSGSTGKPKGVMLMHRGVCNFASAYVRELHITSDSRMLQFASLCFDASVAEIFSALIGGARLYLARQETLTSPIDLQRLLQSEAITHAILPPAMLGILSNDDLPALQALISAGEACAPEIAARWKPGRQFFNGYGPTEATVGPTLYRVDDLNEFKASVPIGRPIANMQCCVLDAHMRPVPVGVPGELHIGGVGLARGYLNRPELTANKFVNYQLPITNCQSPIRLYKTGDLVRYCDDGNLEFLGRLDDQVKVRGFRIELGEIEAALAQHAQVREVAVVAREDIPNDRRLVAYVAQTDDGQPLAVDTLREFLRTRLPSHMIPSAFVMLAQLPRLPNGKVDRRTLPMPEQTDWGITSQYVAPRMPTEEILAGIWAQVLNVERIGIHDNFFDLGGHSLVATRVVARVLDAFQIELPLRSLFEMPTVAQLATQIQEIKLSASVALPPIERAARDQPLPLSFAQQRLWFLDQLEPGNLFYNIPMVVRLTGTLDVTALEKALNEIVRRHESLRTTFTAVDGKPFQVIAPELALTVPVIDLRDVSESERETRALQMATEQVRQPFDLERGPLLRARLFRLGEHNHIALLTMHHIVSDGWSMGVLMRELAALYQICVANEMRTMEALPIQYADFAHWQREWLQGDVLESQLEYWKKQLAGSPPLLELPTDRPRPAMQSSHGTQMTFTLPESLSNALRAFSRQENVTLFMTLLATFQTLLYRYSGQDDICVGTPIANRHRAELENLIGFFVNTLVMRSDFSDDPSFRDLLKRVREMTLDAYAHQDLPFEMLVDTLQPQRDLSHTPLFQTMFVLDNTPRQNIALPDLTIHPLPIDSGNATFDLTLVVMDTPQTLTGYCEYNTDLFDADTITRLLAHFQMLLESVVANVDQPVSALPMLTDAERQRILIEWNNTAADFPRDACIHELFEHQVTLRPDALALVFEDQAL
ncbi:MAG: amino acid adenylation domain-containing protein, partial [Chloroflexi bacterium]|nr:amino acid adenylation domain-containing protein [Chloroflexota bacterium]